MKVEFEDGLWSRVKKASKIKGIGYLDAGSDI